MGEGDIAVVGMSARLPGAPDVATFWRNLVAGVCSVRRHDRRDLLAAGVEPALLADPAFVPADGFLADADAFDADFFGITAREAALTDPQHRLFLECAWSALEDAGHPPSGPTPTVGCFASAGMSLYAGARMSSYLTEAVLGDGDLVEGSAVPLISIANRGDYLATRVAYQLGLRGPAVNVQAACASALVAVHLAVRSLLAGECELALAGAAAVHVPLAAGYLHQPGGLLSATGECRPFDASADGTVGGNGVGVVVLRRLADAVAAGDPVRAVITGAAVNNDGRDKSGFTAPSVRGQRAVIAAAHAAAGRPTDTVGFVETHGTATRLGDPIEIRALRLALGTTVDALPCALGAVKANIGHLDTAAGIAALIKTVLVVQHGIIPPVINHRRLNPEIDLAGSPLHIPLAAGPWPGAPGTRRRAAVSAFGAGGTNAHLVVEQAPEPPVTAEPDGPRLIEVSARGGQALRAAVLALAGRLRTDRPRLADVSLTLLAGRTALGDSVSVLADSPDEAADALARAADEVDVTGAPAPAPRAGRPVVLLFPGQGAEVWSGLHRWLAVDPDLRDGMAELCASAGPDLPADLLAPTGSGDPRRRLARYVQPVLVATGIALARVLAGAGVRPSLALGHSLGELAAAAVTGVLEPAAAVAFAATRGRLLDELCEPGTMLVVAADEDTARGAITRAGEGADGVSVAAVNADTSTVLSGPADAVRLVRAVLRAAGVRTGALPTTHAFHSGLVEPAVAGVVAAVAALGPRRPRTPMLSTLTAAVTDEPADPAYWGRQLREPVRFAAALRNGAVPGDAVFVDLGEGGVLAELVATVRPDAAGRTVALDRNDPAPPTLRLLQGLRRQGGRPDWSATALGRSGRRVSLPSYPFQRTRHWPNTDRRATARAGGSAVRLTTVAWTPVAPSPGTAGVAVLLAPTGLAEDTLAAVLRRLPAGSRVLPDWDARPARDAGRLLDAELAAADTVVDLTALGTPSPPTDSADPARWPALRSAVRVAAALARTTRTPGTVTVTTGAVLVPGDPLIRPDQAAVWGLVRALRTEYRGTSMRLLDLATDVAVDPAGLGAELGRVGPAELAVRGSTRLRPILVDAPDGTDGTDTPLLAGPLAGVLVAGGTGGLAAHLVGWFAERGARLIVLAARTPPEPGILAAPGCEVRFERADVGVPADVRRLGRAFDEVPLSCVVAGAGVLRDAVGGRITEADLRAVLAPKVHGTRLLAELATEHGAPVLVMSSLAALLGSPGQGAYAAANAAAEAVAAGAGMRVVSVGWGPWRDVGMSRGLAQDAGPRALPAADWLAVLDRLPDRPTGPLHALPQPLTGDRSVLGAPEPAQVASLAWAERDDDPPSTGRDRWRHAVAEGGAERFVVDVVAGLLRRPAGTVAADAPFVDLGVDSLSGLRLRRDLTEATGVELPATLIYDHPTPRAIGVHLASAAGRATGAATAPDRGEVALLLAGLAREMDMARDELGITAPREEHRS